MSDILDTNQLRRFQQRVNALKDDGFFLPQARDLAGDHTTGTRYLIVSYGGTGAKALFGVKAEFEKIIPADQLEDRVRFLAIDTDKDTQVTTVKTEDADGNEKTEEVKLLEDIQFLQLRGSNAKGLFNGADLPGSVLEWIDPALVNMLRADVTKGNQGTYLKDTGASGIRQIGRLSLYPGQTRSQIATRIRTLVSEITVGTAAPLRVIILTGISGGTGSGTVIDLTYLIRDTISSMPGNIKDKTEYLGFIMLPTTGTSHNPDDITHGNRNGYAALKEINHYMNLQQRNSTVNDADKREKYTFTYGDGHTVKSDSKIFSICFLMDGVAGGVVHENPMKQVTTVIAQGLLDIVTANQIVDANGQGVQCLDSFMNDADTFRNEMLGKASPIQKAPRDADYVYCALGHAEFSIPTHLLKTFIAKKMLDKVYAMFQNCGAVEESDAKEMLETLSRKGGNSVQEVRKNLLAQLKPTLKSTTGNKCGPWFVINLLYAACNNVIPAMERAWFKPGWAKEPFLGYVKEAALQLNNRFFKTFVASLEALKQLLGEQYKTVISSTPEGNTYHFMPTALHGLEQTEAVVKRLGAFANPALVEQVYQSLVDDAYQNTMNWTGFVSEDNASSRNAIQGMRRFWNTQLEKLLKNHLQDMLVRYFAKNPNAKYDPADPESIKHLQSAANAIYDYMLGAAGLAQPMLDIGGNSLTTEDLKGHTYLMVPEEAKDLVACLEDVAKTKALAGGDQVRVCTSHSSDTVACYRQFTSIPAFLLRWTQEAEESYEDGIQTAVSNGLHMSQTVGGKRWTNFPNLLPRTTWQLQDTPHKNVRENALADKAVDLFNRAAAIPGMAPYTVAPGTAVKTYSVCTLPAKYRPADDMFKKLDVLRGKDAEEQMDRIRQEAQALAQKLCDSVAFASIDTMVEDLAQAGIECEAQALAASPILTYAPANETPEDWFEFTAGTMLRKLPDTMYALDGTLLVMEALKPLVEAKLHVVEQYRKFVQYLAAGLFTTDATGLMWSYTSDLGVTANLYFASNTLEEAAPYYFLFKAYCASEAKVDGALCDLYKDQHQVPANKMDPEFMTRIQAYRASGAALKELITAWTVAKPHPLNDKTIALLAEAEKVSLEDVQAFYEKLLNTANLIANGITNIS